MKQHGLSFFTDTHLTILGLVIFIVVFAAIFFWTFRKSAKGHYEKMAELPLTKGGSNE